MRYLLLPISLADRNRKRSKRFSLPNSIRIILLCFLIFSLVSFFAPQSAMGDVSPVLTTIDSSTNGINQAHNFLEYTNYTYGITIQYPDNWIKQENISNSSSVIVRFISPSHVNGLSVGAAKVASNTNLTEEVAANTDMLRRQFPDFNLSPDESGPITLAGQPAEITVYTWRYGQTDIKQMDVFMIKGNTLYEIGYFGTMLTYPDDLQTAQQMINSFGVIPIPIISPSLMASLIIDFFFRIPFFLFGYQNFRWSGIIGSRTYMRYRKRINVVYNELLNDKAECLRNLRQIRMEVTEIYYPSSDLADVKVKGIYYKQSLILRYLIFLVAPLVVSIWKLNVSKAREYALLDEMISIYITKASK